MNRDRAFKPYEPELICLCDDWDCCGVDGGSWQVNCRHCRQTWPCEDFIATHSESDVRRAKRYTNAREYPPWPEAEESGTPYGWMDRFDKWAHIG